MIEHIWNIPRIYAHPGAEIEETSRKTLRSSAELEFAFLPSVDSKSTTVTFSPFITYNICSLINTLPRMLPHYDTFNLDLSSFYSYLVPHVRSLPFSFTTSSVQSILFNTILHTKQVSNLNYTINKVPSVFIRILFNFFHMHTKCSKCTGFNISSHIRTNNQIISLLLAPCCEQMGSGHWRNIKRRGRQAPMPIEVT